jgi:apolipoprotein N-acyltransferase
MAGSTEGRRVSGSAWWQLVAAGLAFSLLACLAYPPLDVWVVAFVTPLPLIWAGCRAAERPLAGALLVSLGVLPLWFFQQRWLIEVTSLGYPFLAVYLSLCTGFGVYLIARIRRRATGVVAIPMFLLAPVALTAVEVLRGEILLTGYAWFLAGHPLIESPMLAAPAAVFGAYFVSMLVCALAGAAAVAAGWSGVPRARGGQAALGIALVWFLTASIGWRAGTPGPDAFSMSVAVVQTNLPQSNKMGWSLAERQSDMRRFAELTRQAGATRPPPDVILWPETMFPGISLSSELVNEFDAVWSRNNPGMAAAGERSPYLVLNDDLLKLQTEIGIPMIVGAIAMPDPPKGLQGERADRLEFGEQYNSAFVIASGRVLDVRYDKIDLTPFGEVIPYVWRWKKLQDMIVNLGAEGMAFNLRPGTEPVTLPVAVRATDIAAVSGESVRVAVPICFEVTRAGLCRYLVCDGPTRRAAAIFNLSNDGWFGQFTGGREQHLQAARWRCVELGVPMARAVNTGISAAVDSRGRLLQTGPGGRSVAVKTDGVMSVKLLVEPDRPVTIYGRIGDLLAWLVLMGAGAWWLWRVVRG